jgi:DNA polymerase-3 subunit alpha
MSFVHLHNHTHYSLLDGLSRPRQIVQNAKKHGSPAVGISDHGVLYGAVEFYKEAKAEGVKPIIGCEMYITPDRNQKDSSVKKSNHLLLMAKNNEGYRNLLQLVTIAHLEGFYYKPRIDHEVLYKHREGLIATSTCLMGEIPQAILEKDEKKAMDLIKQYQDIFGKEDFYMEVQDHEDIDEQIMVNNKVIELAKELKIPLVGTNDCHYVNKDDHHAHDILVCIQTGKTLLDEDRMKYTSNFCLKSPEEMKESFKDYPEAIESTLEIAEKCDVKIDFGQNLLPKFPTPNKMNSIEFLRSLCENGLNKLYENRKEEAQTRLDYELGVIDRMGFADYFLIVHDIIKHAKDTGIVVGPGRGSAAGSIIAYTLGITTVDPLKYGLIFERFLNPERVSMPDIDIDFADHRRGEVFDYVKERYGDKNVAQVITFGTMTAKAAVRDVGRAMGYPYAEVDAVSKLLPPMVLGKHKPLEKSIVEEPELKAEYEKNPRVKALMDNAIKLEGTIRHAGTHACAVAVSEEPLTNFTPLQYASGKDDSVVTQFSMKPLEEIGILKIDFLGLRNLTVIEHTLNILKIKRDIEIDLADIPLDDSEAFQLLSEGRTTGVFQLESAGMKRYLKDLKPTRLEDIIAMNALYRPGPMDYIPAYIKGKHEPKTIKYMHPLFENILSETYGVGVYQEQILEIAKVFAGFSLGEADLLRKAVGKKDPKLLAEQRQKFVDGAVSEGHKGKFAEKVFDDVIEPFAGYGFNKAHATCYAMIAYHTAYLKAHFPTEFMAALLTSDKDATDRVVIEINECAAQGIKVLPPSVNDSFEDFTVVDDKTIRFGLAAIKGIGAKSVERLIEVRNTLDDKFESLAHFAKSVPKELLNKKNIQALAYAGAFDDFGSREQIAENYQMIVDFGKSQASKEAEGQTDIFGMMDEEHEASNDVIELPEVRELSRVERLKLEKNCLGLYVSGHPLQGLSRYVASKVRLAKTLTEKDVGKDVKVGGLISAKRKLLTKSGEYMMFVTLEDPSGEIEIVLFPRSYNQFAEKFEDEKFIVVDGKLDMRRNIQVMARNVQVASISTMIENAKESGRFDESEVGLYYDHDEEEDVVPAQSSAQMTTFIVSIPKSASSDSLSELKKILSENIGETKIELHFVDGQKLMKRVKLAQGIDLNPELRKKITNLF